MQTHHLHLNLPITLLILGQAFYYRIYCCKCDLFVNKVAMLCCATYVSMKAILKLQDISITINKFDTTLYTNAITSVSEGCQLLVIDMVLAIWLLATLMLLVSTYVNSTVFVLSVFLTLFSDFLENKLSRARSRFSKI